MMIGKCLFQDGKGIVKSNVRISAGTLADFLKTQNIKIRFFEKSDQIGKVFALKNIQVKQFELHC